MFVEHTGSSVGKPWHSGSLRMVTSALLRREPVLGALQKLRMKTEEENRVHMEIEMFLKKEQQVSLRDLCFLI